MVKGKNGVIALLAGIVLVGIFLRTYHFYDWLRFSHDQARDAWLIHKALVGSKSLPLLGPNAGTTAYQLGPIYYYFSFVSGKIFGDSPASMAYPSLIFSILSLPLLFFFIREFFSDKVSLALTAIASVSYFLVINSRFSSNPNLITFFVLLYLYAMLKLLDGKETRWYGWSALAGVGLGVAVQLHTTLLITMPIVTTVLLGYLAKIGGKKKMVGLIKSGAVLLAVVVALNIPQVLHELNSGGKNTRVFFEGFERSKGGSNYGEGIFLISACQMQANTHILSSLQDDIRCDEVFRSFDGGIAQQAANYSGLVLMVLFSIGGYVLLWKRFTAEKDRGKRNFLLLVGVFNGISLAIMVPIANIIYVGYFINLAFMPLVLLGIFMDFAQEKYGRKGVRVGFVVVGILIAIALIRDGEKALRYRQGLENNEENSTLGQVRLMQDYVMATAGNQSIIYFSGQDDLKNRFFYPLEYFARMNKKEIEKVDLEEDGKDVPQDAPIYYIEDAASDNAEVGSERFGRAIISSKTFSRQRILILERTQWLP